MKVIFWALAPVLLLTTSCNKFDRFFGVQKTEQSANKRAIAQAATNHVITPSEVSAEAGFAKFKKDLSGCSSADELAEFIAELESPNYRNHNMKTAKTSLSYLFALENVRLLKVYRGVFYRMRNLVSKHNLPKAIIVSALRVSAAGIESYLPGQQWESGFNYLVEPFYSSEKKDINNDTDFKNFLTDEAVPALEVYLTALNYFIEKAEDSNLYWDNALLNSNFNTAGEDRVLKLGLVELKLLKSGVLLALSNISSLKSYRLVGLFQLLDDISKKYGVGVLFDPAQAFSKKRNGLISRAMSQGFLSRIADKSFNTNLKASHDYLLQSIEESEEAWKQIKKNSSYDKIFKAQSILPFSRMINTSFSNIRTITSDNSGKLVSVISNGEEISFNIKKFFIDDPITGKQGRSFADFLPIDYNDGPGRLSKKITSGGKKQLVTYRNYRQAGPAKWNQEIYRNYFGTSDARLVNRVLAQSWGVPGLSMLLTVSTL